MFARVLSLGAVTCLSIGLVAHSSGSERIDLQTRDKFDFCSTWKSRHREATAAGGIRQQGEEMYRIGVSNGFLIGMLASPLAYFWSVTPPPKSALDQLGPPLRLGLERLAKNPPLLIDAFDTRCGDFRNDALELADVGVVAMLEIGGLSADRAESVFAILRLGDPTPIKQHKVWAALTK